MKKVVAILTVLALFLAGCQSVTGDFRQVDLHQAGSWQKEESLTRDCVSATVKGTDYLFLGVQPNYSGNDNLFVVLDISNPASPREISSLVVPGRSPIYGIVTDGTTVYMKLMRGYWIVDVSDPFSPRELSYLETESNPGRLFLLGDYLYCNYPESKKADDLKTGIRIIDVKNPSNPQIAASVPVAPESYIWSSAPGRLYCTGSEGFRVLDVSSPLEPREIGFFPDPTGIEGHSTTGSDWDAMDGFLDVEVSGSYAYIASAQSGLRVLDISDPEQISEVYQQDIDVIALDISIRGSLALVSGANRQTKFLEFLAFDISNPASPKAAGSLETSTFPFVQVLQTGDYAFATGNPELYVLGLYEE